MNRTVDGKLYSCHIFSPVSFNLPIAHLFETVTVNQLLFAIKNVNHHALSSFWLIWEEKEFMNMKLFLSDFLAHYN